MARPRIEIDPQEIVRLVSEGAKVVELAEIFDCDPKTISSNFSRELRKGRFERDQSLRRAQLSTAKNGNPTMLIWLGKQYLGQADASIDDHIHEAIEAAGLTKEDLLELIKNKDR